jgi:hypothetical protein
VTLTREECLQMAARLDRAAEQTRRLAAEYDEAAAIWRQRAEECR